MTVCSAVLIVCCSTTLGQISAGDVISIDFGQTPTNTAQSPNWNVFSPNSRPFILADLIRRSDGANTGVSVNAAGFTNEGGNNSSGAMLGGSGDISIYEDNIFSNDDVDIITIRLFGLDSELTYDLSGGFFRTANADRFNNTFTVGTDVRTNTAVGGFLNSFETFSGLSAPNGEIFLTIEAVGSGPAVPIGDSVAAISELTLTASTAVPEPTSFALLGLGAVLVATRRRR